MGGLTLNRFLALHYVFGFLLTGMVVIHLALLHEVGSSQPFKCEYVSERKRFYPNFVNKDVLGFIVFLVVFSIIVVYIPNIFNHPVNYNKANPMVTPPHIVPE